jgi:TolB protein
LNAARGKSGCIQKITPAERSEVGPSTSFCNFISMRVHPYFWLAWLIPLLLLPACGEEPEIPYRIAYNVLEDPATDDYDIYVMNLDGSGKRNITNHPDVARVCYAWKDKLYFISDRDTCNRCFFLYEMDANGNGIRKVTELQLEDSWMSSRLNGKEMVISGRIGDELHYQLFLIDATTGDFHQLTHDTAALHRDPAFTPDGREVVFAYKPDHHNPAAHEELWIMDADGRNPRRLVHSPPDESAAEHRAYPPGPPRWCPAEEAFSYPSKQKGKYSLFAIKTDGSQPWKLTSISQNEGGHHWSPDGKWLAVELFDDAQTTFDIYLLNWKTQELLQLTDSPQAEQTPVFVLPSNPL